MNSLFDRYFFVLAGRASAENCGAIASVSPPGDVLTLDWPPDWPDAPATEEAESDSPAK